MYVDIMLYHHYFQLICSTQNVHSIQTEYTFFKDNFIRTMSLGFGLKLRTIQGQDEARFWVNICKDKTKNRMEYRVSFRHMMQPRTHQT